MQKELGDKCIFLCYKEKEIPYCCLLKIFSVLNNVIHGIRSVNIIEKNIMEMCKAVTHCEAWHKWVAKAYMKSAQGIYQKSYQTRAGMAKVACVWQNTHKHSHKQILNLNISH